MYAYTVINNRHWIVGVKNAMQVITTKKLLSGGYMELEMLDVNDSIQL